MTAKKSTTKKPAVRSTPASRQKTTRKATKPQKNPHWLQRIPSRIRDLVARRPHHSFRRTSKRVMPRTAPLPGYLAFTKQVLHTMKRFKKPLVAFGIIFVISNLLVIGFVQQENYQFFSETISELSSQIAGGDFGKLAQGVTLFGIAVTGGLNGSLSEVQQVLLSLSGVILWLSLVWFLRHRLQGEPVGVRDSIYNASAPLVPMLALFLVAVVQLLPAALGLLVFTIAQSAGITGGVEMMMFAIAGSLFVLLSLYWLVGTFFASIIVTIPGTYPLRAIRLAGDIVVGRRLQLLLRMVWMVTLSLLLWLIILLPTLLFAGSVSIPWLPLVQIVIQLLSAFSLVFSVTYIYLLYRRMLDEPDSER